jgi:hypothetical protein
MWQIKRRIDILQLYIYIALNAPILNRGDYGAISQASRCVAIDITKDCKRVSGVMARRAS